MLTKIGKFLYVAFLSMFLSLFVVSCFASNPSAPQAQAFSAKDKRELQGATTTQSKVIDNSSGSTPLKQNVYVPKQFYRSIEFDLDSRVQLDEGQVRKEIYNSYNVSPNDTKVCPIQVDVPVGKIYKYDLEWTEILREGVIEDGSGSGRLFGTYKIRIDLNCQMVGLKVE